MKTIDGLFLMSFSMERRQYNEGIIYTTVNGYRTLLDVLSFIQNSNNIAKIPKNLSVFLIAGEEEPVGNYGKAVKNVYEIYKKAGIKDISIKLYKNDRHELINETDKEDVYDDIRHWLICHL